MDKTLISLQAKLDQLKSVSNINADIKKLQGQLKQISVQAKVDPKAAQMLAEELEQLINQKITISNIEIDQSSAVKSAQQVGTDISQNIADGMNQSRNNWLKDTLGLFDTLGLGDELSARIKNVGKSKMFGFNICY